MEERISDAEDGRLETMPMEEERHFTAEINEIPNKNDLTPRGRAI